MSRRFAERTEVAADKTQGEVKAMLRKMGADQIAVYESAERSAVAFRLAGNYYRITVPIDPKSAKADQEERRAWRLILLLIKAKTQAISEGATTFEREFLADMMMHDGSTVGEWAGNQLAIAHREGRMPTALLLEGPKR